MLTLATFPAPATLMTEVGSWSSPLFTDLLPFAYFGVGMILGGMLVRYIVDITASAIGSLIRR